MNVKRISIVLLLPVSLFISLWGVVHVVTTRDAQYSYTSPSGRYVMENIHVGGVLVAFEDLAYLRVIDKNAGSCISLAVVFAAVTRYAVA